MNRNLAKKIAEVITQEELNSMFENTKNSITNWNVRSSLNPLMSKGKSWNIFYKTSLNDNPIAITNAIREFGEFLPSDLKEKFKPKKKDLPNTFYHEEPNFD